MYEPRFYREWTNTRLVNFKVRDKETDIFVSADKDLKEKARNAVRRLRRDIEAYIKKNPDFEKSLEPLDADEKAPEIVKSMLRASGKTGVGPMAAVAGAINDFLAGALLSHADEVILENGGDVFIRTRKIRSISIYAGDSVLSGKIKIRVKPEKTPLSVCTSSGTVGHSLSFGKADAFCALSVNGALADACATAAANKVKGPASIKEALDFAKSIEGITGAVVIYREKLGTIGEIELA